MLSDTEVVWRHLLAGAADGERAVGTLSSLAETLEMKRSTVRHALDEPMRIGAVVRRPYGLVVLDPFRVAVLWAGRRNIERDVIDFWHTPLVAPAAERAGRPAGAVLGGYGAVAVRIGGNFIADYNAATFYTDDPGAVRALVPAEKGAYTEVRVLQPDRLLERYGPVTPLHQAWVDLFNLKTWNAAYFVEELVQRWVPDNGQAG